MPIKVLPPFLAATGRVLAVPAAPATTWDPAHKTNATLSGSNLITTHSGGGNTDLNSFSIATNGASQKVYFEITATQLTFGGNIGVSQDNTSVSRSDNFASTSKGGGLIATGTFSCGDSADHGFAILPAWGTGDKIDIAFDSGAKLFWARKNNGAWNASHAGTQDPATGQGGMAVTNTPATGPWYVFVGADAVDGDAFTARFASASWLNAVPSGFSQIAA